MEGLTVGVSALFRERLLYRVSPIALITQRLDESVAIRDLLFNDLFDLCDNPRLCKEMMELLGPEPSTIKKLFLNHRKRSKRPQLELFFAEPFPTKGIEEVFRRLILHANEGTDGFVILGTDSFRPIRRDQNNPIASDWWDSVVAWHINLENTMAIWAQRKKESMFRAYVCELWDFCQHNWLMEWNENEFIRISKSS